MYNSKHEAPFEAKGAIHFELNGMIRQRSRKKHAGKN